MKHRKEYGDYYLGLDIGTSSVGWAVTDLDYNILKFHGRGMWGVRLFDEAKTAEERRLFRSARRRNARKTQRIRLLQELFSEEIAKVDFGFFQRLKDSKLYAEDKTERQTNTLFNDVEYTDQDYLAEYPTIYHLRKALMEDAEPHDIRLVYLAIHHILKHRGHFLYDGDISDVSELKPESLLQSLIDSVQEQCGYSITCTSEQAIAEVLANPDLNVTAKKKRLEESLSCEKEYKKLLKELIALLAGGKVSLEKLFGNKAYSESEVNKLSFGGSQYEESEDSIRALLLDQFSVIECAKALYDWGILQIVLGGEKSLSDAKVKGYEVHRADLSMLRAAVREYCPEKYNRVFREQRDKDFNYSAYIGNYRNKGVHQVIEKTCTQDEFCEFLRKKVFKGIEIDPDKYPGLEEKITDGRLVPKQKVKDNGVIPYQVHQKELDRILTNAEKYLPFLKSVDEDGRSVSDKIRSILVFRIPYYVGPVNGAHEKPDGKGFCWAVRKSDVPVRPWNLPDVIDLEASAEKFIRRMTNKCTYLIGEDVLPKDSLLYSRFMVLNELNNLRVDDEKISVELKQSIYRDLFLKRKKVTGKVLREYLISNGVIDARDESKLSGFDGSFKASLDAYQDFGKILKKEHFNDTESRMVENIIRYIVLFGEDRKMLRRKIRNEYGSSLSEEQIGRICKLKYSGWGRLSEAFLTNLKEVDMTTGEVGDESIIKALWQWEGNPNLMELLSNDHGFSVGIETWNNAGIKKKMINYSDLEELYVSVPVKRAIWQTVSIIKELRKILGHDPKKVFVEMARGPEEEKKRRDSRKQKLLETYKSIKKGNEDLIQELEATEEGRLRGDKLYLYYMQMGRCMYSGDRIELSDLGNYDIDHIYPQSRVMDDSLDNRVLVRRVLNAKKSDQYPLPGEWRDKMRPFWSMLRKQGFISEKKYARLIRNTTFTEGELEGFVSRQIVETRQSTKAVAHLLDEMFEGTEIIYVKAGNVSAFRRGVNDYTVRVSKQEYSDRQKENTFPKVREVNDYHHAKDAYLNIVVGNVFNSKFTRNPAMFFKQKDHTYSMNAMYRFPVSRDGVAAWEPSTPEKEGTMATVKKMMRRNNIQFTRYAREVHGGFFDQQILKKGKGQLPLKGSGPIANIEKYGGYNKAAGAYFFLVEHTRKKKRIRSIEFVPVYLAKKIQADEAALLQYCVAELHLEEPRVLLRKIKFDTLFEIDGFRMHLTGRSNDILKFKNGNELVLDDRCSQYIKKLGKFVKRKKQNKDLVIREQDGITREENETILKSLIEKMSTKPYVQRYGNVGAGIDMETFHSLSTEEQVVAVMNILPLLQCNVLVANLKVFGGPESSGTLTNNKVMDPAKSIKIINQSVTGLFVNEIKLAEL